MVNPYSIILVRPPWLILLSHPILHHLAARRARCCPEIWVNCCGHISYTHGECSQICVNPHCYPPVNVYKKLWKDPHHV